jgi:hypothetical protein
MVPFPKKVSYLSCGPALCYRAVEFLLLYVFASSLNVLAWSALASDALASAQKKNHSGR